MRVLMTMTATTLIAIAAPVAAQMHGGGPGGGTGPGGGAGMMFVADDGSLLVTEMAPGGMMGGGTLDPALVNVGPDGLERWRVEFDDGLPMMPVNEGDLVVLVLRDDWFFGYGGTGDGGWGQGGGHHGGGGRGTGDGHADRSILVALELTSGAEQWRVELEGDMVMAPQFAPDGSRMYVTIRDFSDRFGPGTGPARQGGTPPASAMMSTTVVALDRGGTELWRLDLGGQGGGR
jgi:hypothetical protein